MRKMQKIAALGLAGTMALSLAACGGSGDSTADTSFHRGEHRFFHRGHCREHRLRRRGCHPELGPVG